MSSGVCTSPEKKSWAEVCRDMEGKNQMQRERAGEDTVWTHKAGRSGIYKEM